MLHAATNASRTASAWLRSLAWCGLIGAGCVAAGMADETADAAKANGAGQAADDEARQAIVRVARDYELFAGADRRRLVMEAEPVLRWPNPTRETPEGATFIWTLDGRPEAIACIWRHGSLSFA